MAFKIFGRKKNPESVENCSFPILSGCRQHQIGTAGGGAQRLSCNC